MTDPGTGASGPAGIAARPGVPEAPLRRGIVFAVVATALLMSTLDSTIVATALNALRRGLGTSVTLAGWTITAYNLGMVLMLPVTGKLTGRWGPKRVFLASLAVFSLASLGCGLAGNIVVLVILRFLQALGAAGFTPSATRIVVERFGPSRDKVVGLFGSLFTMGAMLGPVVGGIIVSAWSWRGVFLVNVVLGAVLAPACLHFVPRDRPRQAGRPPARLDVRGVILLGVGLAAGMIALALLGDTPRGWLLPCVGAAVVAVAAIAWFGRHIRRAADPLIAPRILFGNGFGAVNTVNILYGGLGTGLVALVPLYAATRFGIDALASGTVLAAEGAAAVAASTVGAFILRRTGYRLPLYAAALLTAAGMAGLAFPPSGVPAYGWLAASAGLAGLGIGWSSPASRNAGLQLVPELAAPLAALRSTAFQVGSIVAVSATTAILAAAGSSGAGAAQALVYAGYGVLLLAGGLAATTRIPDHHGSW